VIAWLDRVTEEKAGSEPAFFVVDTAFVETGGSPTRMPTDADVCVQLDATRITLTNILSWDSRITEVSDCESDSDKLY